MLSSTKTWRIFYLTFLNCLSYTSLFCIFRKTRILESQNNEKTISYFYSKYAFSFIRDAHAGS